MIFVSVQYFHSSPTHSHIELLTQTSSTVDTETTSTSHKKLRKLVTSASYHASSPVASVTNNDLPVDDRDGCKLSESLRKREQRCVCVCDRGVCVCDRGVCV